jgi:16S rRNA (adenine1518-N6/adenine1519-N6)-dimethyltransferase
MAQIDDLPPLRDVIARHGLNARKALGQNFLLDLNLTSRIARSAGALEGVHVVEIGPGPGGLTRAILAAGAAHVTAIEMDARCLPALSEIEAHYPGRLTIIAGDALKVALPPPSLPAGSTARIIANLPYNVATPLIIGWLKTMPHPPWFQSITVMVQREFAERLCGTTEKPKDYGRLSVLTALLAEARILFNVPPSAFVPQPKVMSSVVELRPRDRLPPVPLELLEEVTLAAFGQRRKMLRQSLKSLGFGPELLTMTAINPQARAEEIAPAGFVALTAALQQLRQRG